MKLLAVPMFALSAMNGPWTRAQRIAGAFQDAGHEVVLGMAPDGNCRNPVADRVLELPVPSPMGAPMAVAKRTFPLATKLGIAGRKPVGSFEEVLWLTGNLAHGFAAESVETIRRFIRDEHIDAVYSEYSLPAIIAAKAEDVALFGSHSFPTQASYASAPGKSGGVRKLLDGLGLPAVESALELFERMDRRFIPSCPELEPFEGDDVTFCGFLGEAPAITADAERDALVFYLGTGTVPVKQLVASAAAVAERTGRETYVAGIEANHVSHADAPANLHLAPRFDFSELLPRAAAFINHGGQNSVMDALSHGAPQIVFGGRVFERRYNAGSIDSAGAGIRLESFTADAIIDALSCLEADGSYRVNAAALRERLTALGGAARIVSEIEYALA